jgi:hypothetical protein
MASVQTIAKAQGSGLLLEQLFGIPVSYDYQPNHVRVYYQPDRLKQVQGRVATMAAGGPGDVRIDWFPMVTPVVLKQAAPYAVGLLAAGFLIGKMLR